MAKLFEGIYPPLITSFTESGDIYEKGIRSVVSYLMSAGVHGFFINGSYGSAPLMTTAERKRVAEIIHHEVNGRLPIITHVGKAATRATIDLARHAEGLGSAAVAAVMPYYYSGADAYDDDQIIRHYADIAASVSVPTFMYNNPRTSGYDLTPELLAKLVKVGVLGMKDSSGSFTLLGEFNQAATRMNPAFACMSGSVGLLQPAYNIGIKGWQGPQTPSPNSPLPFTRPWKPGTGRSPNNCKMWSLPSGKFRRQADSDRPVATPSCG